MSWGTGQERLRNGLFIEEILVCSPPATEVPTVSHIPINSAQDINLHTAPTLHPHLELIVALFVSFTRPLISPVPLHSLTIRTKLFKTYRTKPICHPLTPFLSSPLPPPLPKNKGTRKGGGGIEAERSRAAISCVGLFSRAFDH